MKKSNLRATAALQALAILGAGLTASMIVATPASAQDYNQVDASGSVKDSAGKPVAGATVTVTSDDQGFVRTATTDSSGGFRVPALPQGRYTFGITANGYQAYTESSIAINQQGATNLFTLAPTGTAAGSTTSDTGQAIVVTGRRQRIPDFDRNTTGAVINVGELAQRVPVARSISAVIQLSPGTTEGDRAFGDLANISGSSVAENAFFLNGLNITNFRTGLGAVVVPFDFYQTVEVKNGALAAEYGRLTGGMVNATTKSGSNTYHGSIGFSWQANSLRAKAPNTITADNDARYFERKDTVIQLSGPIIKDRLFVYGLYQSQNTVSKLGVTSLRAGSTPASPSIQGNQYIVDRTTAPFWAVKVDAIPFDGQRLEATVFDTRSVLREDVFGTPASGLRYNPITNAPGNYDSTTLFGSGGLNYVGRYTGTFTRWLTLSAAYGRNRDRDTTEATSNLSSVVDTRSGQSISIGNPTANVSTNADERKFYRGDVDVYVKLLGSHHFRAGYDHEALLTKIITQSYGIGQITLTNGSADDQYGITTGEYAQVRFFRNGGAFKSTNEAFYLEDNWKLFDNRLNLNVGIRNDKFTNRNIEGKPFYKSGNQWGPRLSASFDPTGDSTSKVYGSFSRYYFPIAASTNNRLGGSELDQNSFYRFSGFDANGQPILTTQLVPTDGAPCIIGSGTCSITSDGTAGDTATLISSSLKAQKLDEFIFGAEHRFGRRIRLNAYGTYRKLATTLEDAAINGAVVRYCAENNITALTDGSTCAQTYGPNTNQQYILLNPGSGATFLLDRAIAGEATPRTVTLTPTQLGLAKARRTYKSITIQASREFDGVWSADFSYTYSKLKGNTEGGVRSDGNGQADTGATVDFDFAGLGIGTYGYLPNDRRHNFKAFGSYQPLKWLTLGANVSVTSPRRFGCLGTVPPSIDAGAATYGANGTFCNLNSDGSVRTTPAASGEILPPRQSVPRGTGNRGSWIKVVNLDAQVRVPTERFNAALRLSVFNVFNSHGVTDLEERGTLFSGAPRITYGTTTAYQAPRSARLQLTVGF